MSNILGGVLGDSFGVPTQELNDLAKALGTGTANTSTYVQGGAPFRVQSLEGILKVVTYQDRNIVFWKDIPKLQAFNTVEEYNQLTSYGSTGSGFFSEGGLPTEDDSTYVRQTALVKFMGTTGVVTHPLTLVRSAHGDVIGREAKNRTLWLLQRVEEALFGGNSAINPFAFDGLEKQVVTANAASQLQENVIDLRGAALDEETSENLSRVVADNFGTLTTLYAGNKVLTDLSKQILPNGRFSLPYGDKEGRLGYRVRFFDSQVGSYELKPNVFLKAGGPCPTVADAGTSATGTIVNPLLVGGIAKSAITQTSQFTAGATYSYRISSIGAAGETVPSGQLAQAVAGSTECVQLVITNVTGATGYKVYRAPAGTTTGHLLMTTIPATVGATTTFVDANADLPGTSKAYGVMIDPDQGLAFKQLAPLMKMDLATVAASYRFMVLLYGVPIVYSPLKQVVIKNIGNL